MTYIVACPICDSRAWHSCRFRSRYLPYPQWPSHGTPGLGIAAICTVSFDYVTMSMHNLGRKPSTGYYTYLVKEALRIVCP